MAPQRAAAKTAATLVAVQNEGIELHIPRGKAVWVYWALDVMEKQAGTDWRHLRRGRLDRRRCEYFKDSLLRVLVVAEESGGDDMAVSAYPATGHYWWAALRRAGLHGEARKLAANYAERGAHLVRDLDPPV